MKKIFVDEKVQSYHSDLKNRGLELKYKNAFPSYPKPQIDQKKFDHLMIGFKKRLQNWMIGLDQLENPGGKLNGKKRENPAIQIITEVIEPLTSFSKESGKTLKSLADLENVVN